MLHSCAILRCLLLAFIFGGLSGCSTEREQGVGIASLSPAITETLLALDLADAMVARSDYDHAPAVAHLPTVGTALSPNFEGLARIAPEVIVTDSSGGYEDELTPLAPVLSLNWMSPADLQANILVLGRRFDRQELAAELVEAVKMSLRPRSGFECPTVLLTLQSEGIEQIWFLPRNSLHGHLVPAVGGCHAIDRDVSGAAVLGPEQLLRINPDVLVVFSSPSSAAKTSGFEQLPELSAVKNDRIIVLREEGQLIPGPSIIRVADRLRDAMGLVWPVSM